MMPCTNMISWRRIRPARCALTLMLGAVAACFASQQRGVPLYAGGPRSRDEIALLVGPIASVDGQRVAPRGNTFELLPGCHIVEIGGSEGAISSNSAWDVSFPHLSYAFDMRAGRIYSIEFDENPALGQLEIGTGRVVARERYVDGHVSIVPIARASDVARCQAASVP